MRARSPRRNPGMTTGIPAKCCVSACGVVRRPPGRDALPECSSMGLSVRGLFSGESLPT